MAVATVVVLAGALAALGFALLVSSLVRSRPAHAASPAGTRVAVTPSGAEAPPPPAPPRIAPAVPDSPEVNVNRRLFLNRAWLLAMTVFGVAFGGTSLGFFWPMQVSGFGGKIRVPLKRDEILDYIRTEKKPWYTPEGRFYIVAYDTSDENNEYVQAGVAKDGLMTVYQKCAHLGCRVPFCSPSQWFECPCHGSKYNIAGEVMPGSPAAHGLWRFPIEIEEGTLIVDTSSPTANPPGGTDTIRQPPSGPHCISEAEGA